jgi:hypothetical protein
VLALKQSREVHLTTRPAFRKRVDPDLPVLVMVKMRIVAAGRLDYLTTHQGRRPNYVAE